MRPPKTHSRRVGGRQVLGGKEACDCDECHRRLGGARSLEKVSAAANIAVRLVC